MPAAVGDLFEVRQTEHAGRGVFAMQDVVAGTLLLSSSDLVVAVLYRDYIREVCVWCFAYDRGRYWTVRESLAGLAWCSEECKKRWLDASGGDVALLAHQAVENLLKRTNRQQDDGEEQDTGQLAIENVETSWQAAEKIGMIILQGRGTIKPTKAQTRTLANLRPPSAAVLNYLLAAVLSRSMTTGGAWQDLLALHPASTPYTSTSVLQKHIIAYQHLLAVLPTELLQYATPTILRSVVSRDTHNSFGIRSLDDEGSEMFGHGIWPSASYWNHSCNPNIARRRIGRTWEFRAMRAIEAGEELFITYLNGDEKQLGVTERMDRLWNAWKFRCACPRCLVEGRL